MKRIQTILLSALVLVAIPVAIVSLVGRFSPAPAPVVEENGLGVRIPVVVALYTDSLASRLTNTGTSFTLVRGTDKQSRSLSGYYGFVIDEGTTSEEFFTATCAATACTIVARGIDVQDGETSVTALKFEHRRGAVVKQTDFPILAYLARIANGEESASSTFMIGDGSTTTTLNKYLKVDNGTAALPFLRYNETLAKWQFSDDGLNTITFATSSASGLSASTTAATFITDSQVGTYTSSTASPNGGYIAIAQQADGKYRVYFDSPLFLSTPQTFSNINGTSSGNFTVNSPTSSRDAVNKGYSDSSVANSVAFGQATGTAQVAITAGQAVWLSATSSQIMVTDTTAPSSTYQFIGIAAANAAAGATVTYTKPGGINCNQSGLTAGLGYYVNGATGGLATSPGTYIARIGIATSASCVQVMTPQLVATGSFMVNATGNYLATTTAFYPAHITLTTACKSGGSLDTFTANFGMSIGDESNTATHVGHNGTNYGGGHSPTLAIRLYCANATPIQGTVASRSTAGAVINISNAGGGGAGLVTWKATSE